MSEADWTKYVRSVFLKILEKTISERGSHYVLTAASPDKSDIVSGTVVFRRVQPSLFSEQEALNAAGITNLSDFAAGFKAEFGSRNIFCLIPKSLYEHTNT